jgi:hypothetical protein
VLQERCPKGGENQKIDQDRIDNMNEEINNVIPGDIQPVNGVVQGERQIPCVSPLKKSAYRLLFSGNLGL